MKKSKAIEYYGGGSALARALNISKQAVSKWPDIVPIKQALALERKTGGKLALVLGDYR